jgi:hypothetical protein
MTEQQQIKNILAFLAIFFGESKLWQDEIMKRKPDYLIEKFNRYILSDKYQADWGLHPLLRKNVFNMYCDKHGIPYDEYEEIS